MAQNAGLHQPETVAITGVAGCCESSPSGGKEGWSVKTPSTHWDRKLGDKEIVGESQHDIFEVVMLNILSFGITA